MEDNANNKIKFPIVSFGKDCISFIKGEKDSVVCSSYGKSYFDNLVVIDIEGKEFQLQKANKIGKIGSFLQSILNPKIRVRLVYNKNEIQKISLENFKNKLISGLKHDKDFWNSDGEFPQRVKFISEAKQISDIICKMTDDYYREY